MITEKDIYDFTRGACWILAEEISRVTGWEIRVFYPPYPHAFVRTPDGKYLDIEGLRSGGELMGDYGRSSNFQFRKYAEGFFGLPRDFMPEDYYRERARQLVPELLEMVKGES